MIQAHLRHWSSRDLSECDGLYAKNFLAFLYALASREGRRLKWKRTSSLNSATIRLANALSMAASRSSGIRRGVMSTKSRLHSGRRADTSDMISVWAHSTRLQTRTDSFVFRLRFRIVST